MAQCLQIYNAEHDSVVIHSPVGLQIAAFSLRPGIAELREEAWPL